MNFKEAVCAAIDGKRIRRSAWSKEKQSLHWHDGYLRYLDGEAYVSTSTDCLNITDWEIFIEKPPPVDNWPRVSFEEALKAMKEGAYIKREHWQLRDSYYMSMYGGCTIRLADTTTKVVCISSDEVLADDWQILENEPGDDDGEEDDGESGSLIKSAMKRMSEL